MIEIGQINTLRIVKEVDFGLYLEGDNGNEILLPIRYVPAEYNIDDDIEVFIYLDSEERIIATTQIPYATVGEFAYLKVVQVNKVGAFLDWGLQKDLFVPFREQKDKMEEDKSYLVFVYLDDESQRIVASSNLSKFVDNIEIDFGVNDEVDLLITGKTDLGYKVIINNNFWGVLYENEVFQQLKQGQEIIGFVKKIRDDDKIDVSLFPFGYNKIENVAIKIAEELELHGGNIAISDKSSSEEISAMFNVSKKMFKKAIGNLYKRRLIIIEETGIRLK